LRVGLYPHLLINNYPFREEQWQWQLLETKSFGPHCQTSEVSDLQISGWAAANFHFWIINVIEDKVAVRRIKANQDLSMGIRTTDTVPLVSSTDGDLTGLADFALPGKGSQVSIYSLQVKECQLVLRLKWAMWLKQLRMGNDWRETATPFSARRQLVVQFVNSLVEDLLQLLRVGIFVADNRIVVDRAVTAFYFCIVSKLRILDSLSRREPRL